jgi:enoyl-CoA hydratase/carnithine racemase
MVGPIKAELVTVAVDDRGVALLRLRRPAALNAFSHALVDAFEAALDGLEAAETLRAVVVAGSGRAFAVGAALDELHAATPAERSTYNRRLASAFDRVEMLRVPTIAAIDGYALGGGLELALACTLRVIGQDARVGLPETRLGLVPGAGGSWRLPRLIGRGPALLLMLTGDQVDGGRAGELGIAEVVVPSGEAEAAALELAGRIAANAPAAVSAVLDVGTRLSHDGPDAAARSLAGHIDALLASADMEGRVAAFLARDRARSGG